MTTELDQATMLVTETINHARSGDGFNINDTWDRWHGSPITLLGAALLAAIGRIPDQDPNPDPRDWRRATTFLAGWATGDPGIFGPVAEEAEQDGRTQHLLAALAEHAVLGLGLRDNPEQLAEIRRAIAIWMNEENRND